MIDFPGCSHMLNNTVFHHSNTIGNSHSFLLIVSYINCSNSNILLEVSDNLPHFHTEFGIQIG